MIAVYRRTLYQLSLSRGTTVKRDGKVDERMVVLLQILDKCVDALDCEWEEYGGKPPHLPPVLCHVDLQPQNLAFWKECCNSN